MGVGIWCYATASPQSNSATVRRRSRKYLVAKDPSLYPGAGPLINEEADNLNRAYGHAVTYDSMATSPLRDPPVGAGRGRGQSGTAAGVV